MSHIHVCAYVCLCSRYKPKYWSVSRSEALPTHARPPTYTAYVYIVILKLVFKTLWVVAYSFLTFFKDRTG